MDILAPVFAYLTAVAGIVGAFLVSFYVVFSTPKQPVIAEHNAAAIVSATAAKVAQPAELKASADIKKPVVKTAAADNPPVNHVAATTQKREDTPAQTAPARAASAAPSAQLASSQKPTVPPAVAEARSKGKITRAQWRQIVQQERNRRLAQGGDFESRFLGYAD